MKGWFDHMIYTFDGNNVKAPTPDTSNSDMGNEVIHTYEDFNEEEEDFAPIKKPGFFSLEDVLPKQKHRWKMMI